MICNVATIPHFTAEKMKAAPLALPPLATQRRVARFLDERTARVDGLIEKLVGCDTRPSAPNNPPNSKSLLGLLMEYRSALITATVTGQLADLQ